MTVRTIELGKEIIECPLCHFKFSGTYPMVKTSTGVTYCKKCYVEEIESRKHEI